MDEKEKAEKIRTIERRHQEQEHEAEYEQEADELPPDEKVNRWLAFVEADKIRTQQQEEEEAQEAPADAGKGMDDSRIITVIPDQASRGARGGRGRGRGASRNDSANRVNQEDYQERRSGSSSLKAKSWLKQAGPPPRTPTPTTHHPKPTATTSTPVKSNLSPNPPAASKPMHSTAAQQPPAVGVKRKTLSSAPPATTTTHATTTQQDNPIAKKPRVLPSPAQPRQQPQQLQGPPRKPTSLPVAPTSKWAAFLPQPEQEEEEEDDVGGDGGQEVSMLDSHEAQPDDDVVEEEYLPEDD